MLARERFSDCSIELNPVQLVTAGYPRKASNKNKAGRGVFGPCFMLGRRTGTPSSPHPRRLPSPVSRPHTPHGSVVRRRARSPSPRARRHTTRTQTHTRVATQSFSTHYGSIFPSMCSSCVFGVCRGGGIYNR